MTNLYYNLSKKMKEDYNDVYYMDNLPSSTRQMIFELCGILDKELEKIKMVINLKEKLDRGGDMNE